MKKYTCRSREEREDLMAQIIDLKKSGMSEAEAARSLGVLPKTAGVWRQRGVKAVAMAGKRKPAQFVKKKRPLPGVVSLDVPPPPSGRMLAVYGTPEEVAAFAKGMS